MERRQQFKTLLASKDPILLDGAIGTELYNRGVFINRSFEEVNLGSKDLIRQLHRDYLKAGSMVITTNSWGANRLKLKAFNLDDQTELINREAAKIAKEEAGDHAFVMGAMGPLGIRIEPFGPTSYAEAQEVFKEQATGLIKGGVDLISLETFDDLSELKQAIEAIRQIDSEICLIAHVVMSPQGTLPYGTPIPWVMEQLQTWDCDVVGLNCSVGPHPMLSMVEKLKDSIVKPISLQPNAGLPKLVDGRKIYMSTPEYLATYAQSFIQAGVQLLGGCCGTSPMHIKAMAATLRQGRAFIHSHEQVHHNKKAGSKDSGTAVLPERIPLGQKSRWSRKIADKERVFSVELLPPAGIDPEKIIAQSQKLKDSGIDAINIPDGPRASARMSAILTAVMIEQQAQIETVLHYTCRDRNLLGMQSDMLGAQAIGLRNMLLVTGDPPKLGSYPDATGVFDVDSIGLTNMVHRLNGGLDLGNRPIGNPCALSIGVGVNPVHRDFEYEMKRFAWKVDAGAEWAITQPVFDINALMRFFEYIDKHGIRIPIIAGIWPLTSFRNATFMHNEVPGVVIPDAIMKRMESQSDPESAKREGVQIAREMIEELGSSIQGIQISAPFGRIDLALDVIGKSSL